MPGLEPGSGDKTTPELSEDPEVALGGASAEPTSPGPPRPRPFLPEPEPPTEFELGGGGITLLASRPPLAEPVEFLVPGPEEEPTDGGGGTTLDELREEPGKVLAEPLPEDAPFPEVVFDPAKDGGGGITLDEDGD